MCQRCKWTIQRQTVAHTILYARWIGEMFKIFSLKKGLSGFSTWPSFGIFPFSYLFVFKKFVHPVTTKNNSNNEHSKYSHGKCCELHAGCYSRVVLLASVVLAISRMVKYFQGVSESWFFVVGVLKYLVRKSPTFFRIPNWQCGALNYWILKKAAEWIYHHFPKTIIFHVSSVVDVESHEKTGIGLWMDGDGKSYFLRIEKLLGINVIHVK